MRSVRHIAGTLVITAIGAGCAVFVSGCAGEQPAIVRARAPGAQRPGLLGLFRTAARPGMRDGALYTGELKEVKPCAADPRAFGLAPGNGVLVRLEAPVPTDLRVQMTFPSGSQLLTTPEDHADEEQLVRRGSAFFYENGAITRQAATGAVVPREVAIDPGAFGADGRFDIFVMTQSFDPNAIGAERESAPLAVSVVTRCPDLVVELSAPKPFLTAGDSGHWWVTITPSGEAVGTMKQLLTVEGLPQGVQATFRESTLSGSSWSSPFETRLDFTAAANAPPGETPITVRVKLGAIERTATGKLKVKFAE